MGPEIVNRIKDSEIHGDLVGRDKITNIIMFQEEEREFVVTHNTDIKPVSYFTGRETELQELRQRIEDKRKSVLISGMGGIGKTQICRELFNEYYIEQNRGKEGPFSHIGYIEYEGDMGSSLMSCLRYKEQDNPELNQEAAWKELEDLASKGKLLLFVDNVNRPMSEDSGLKRLNHIPGAVMITSRLASFSDEFEPYRIGFLSTEQCIEIYEKIRFENSGKKVKPEEVQDLAYIIENLAGRHTITVQLLANLAHIKIWGIKKLREELENKGFQLEFHKNGELVNIQKSYEVLYSLSKLTEAEQNILEAFSIFPYIPLAAETCNEWLLADAGASEDDILMGLYQKGWLQLDMEHEAYVMHPVFAQFICEKCSPRMEKHKGMVEACQRCLKIPESGSAIECQKYIPFAENMLEKLDMKKNMEQVIFINFLAGLLQYIAEYNKAEKLYGKSLQICKTVLGETHSNTATSYNDLAIVYESQGKYGKAEELFKKSLQIYKKVFGETHPNTATSYNNLAAAYDNHGKYREAKRLYEKSLQIRKKVLGKNHLDTASSYSNLAGLYEKQGKYGRAEELYEKSLQIRERVSEGNHLDIARSYNDLAGLYEKQGKYGRAEELYEKSLQIRERLLGRNHLDTVNSYDALAGLYKRQGKYRRAEELYEKNLQIRERVLGKDHHDTANSYNDLAVAYMMQGKHEKAEKLFKKSLQICKKVLGEIHPSTATVYDNLANVYESQGKCGKAKRLYEKSLQIREKILGEVHPDVAINYHHLAGLYMDQGEDIKAKELYEKSLRICEKVLGGAHPSTAANYNSLACWYMKQEKYEIALAYYIKAYKVLVSKFGISHPDTQIVLKNIVLSYFKFHPEGNFEQWLEEKMKE